MSADKIVEMKPVEKPKRILKPRIDNVIPTDIVDVWRLVESSLRNGGQKYPDTTEDSSEAIRSHLFAYMNSPFFGGSIARIGKRPVGVILGNIAGRPYGRPSRYAFIWCIWVDPQYRKMGVAKAICADYAAKLKKAEIYNVEMQANEELAPLICKVFKLDRLFSIVGGRF